MRSNSSHELRSLRRERAVGPMEDQLVHRSVGASAKFHTVANKIADHKRSSLIGGQLVSWLTGQCEEELSVAVLIHDQGHGGASEATNAFLAERGIDAVAAWNAREDDVFDQRLKGG